MFVFRSSDLSIILKNGSVGLPLTSDEDVDEQLLIMIGFRQLMNISMIVIRANEKGVLEGIHLN